MHTDAHQIQLILCFFGSFWIGMFLLCILSLLWELSFIQHFLKRIVWCLRSFEFSKSEQVIENICCGNKHRERQVDNEIKTVAVEEIIAAPVCEKLESEALQKYRATISNIEFTKYSIKSVEIAESVDNLVEPRSFQFVDEEEQNESNKTHLYE